MLFARTLVDGRLSAIRRWRIDRGVAGRDRSFDEFGSACAGTVTAREREVDRIVCKHDVESIEIESRQRREPPKP
jgi:hypothetical protein